jgi:hypothetical protein
MAKGCGAGTKSRPIRLRAADGQGRPGLVVTRFVELPASEILTGAAWAEELLAAQPR